ncbi:MAG: hypothetical protein AAFO82_01440, partial [Bacteroidota bacterium]
MFHQRISRLLLSLSFLLSSVIFIQAQVVLYDANFSGYGSRSGSATGQVGGRWSSTERSGGCAGDGQNDNEEFFGTRNGKFEIRNVEGSGCVGVQGGMNNSSWQTTPIPIRNYSNVNVVVELTGDGGVNGFEGNPNECVPRGSSDCLDQIRVLVKVDGESFSSPIYRSSSRSFSAIYDEAQGLCGSQLSIEIIGGTQGSDEAFFIEKVLVTGERGGRPSPQSSTIDRCVGEDAVLRIVNVSN